MLIRKVEQRIQQYLTFLDEKKYTKIMRLQTFVSQSKNYNYSVPQDLEKQEITFPYHYGKEKYNYWFFTSFTIPFEFIHEELYLYAPTNADSLVFINGEPKGAVNQYHTKIKILDSDKSKNTLEIAIEAYAGHIIPGYHPMHKPRIMLTLAQQLPSYPITFSTCELVSKNKIIYDLYYDVQVLYELTTQLDNNSLRKNEILRELYYALINIHFVTDSPSLEEECLQASKTLKQLLQLHNSSSVPSIFIVGHAHIDHAWLWPIGETLRKAARTFSNMARLAEEFPEFIFIQSQPAQLELVKKHYPSIFADVQNAYNNGQWEPNGGMWVEADTNIPSGESLIRQFLIGKASTKKNFNYYGDTLWLPDVFGYSANLPQILKGCNIKYFVTSKISWNDTTKFPYDTFNWEGIDGSIIKSHFLTVSYEGFVSAKELFLSWNRVQHKEVQRAMIKPFGEGDGGGGSTRSDVEISKRINDLEGYPKTRWSKVSSALNEIFSTTHNLPLWHGELYLELHRGTYTTIADTKKYNRLLEQSFRNIEFMSVLCSPVISKKVGITSSKQYDHETLNELWKIFLTQQFHDIIPGSSIHQVNVETLQSYKTVESKLKSLEKRLVTTVTESSLNSSMKHSFSSINALSWTRLSLVPVILDLDTTKNYNTEGNNATFPTQLYKDFSNKESLVTVVSIPELGFGTYNLTETINDIDKPFFWENNILLTPFYIVKFNEQKQIISISLKDDSFNYVAEKAIFNTLQFAEDFPITWDAWDIEWDAYEQKIQHLIPVKTEIIKNGPLFLQLRNYYKMSKSEVIQDVLFYSFDEVIEFRTNVKWNEDHRVLRTIFPSRVSSDIAKCEIQNGYLTRSTLKNRDHERAMFEVCAHKWVTLNDGLRGIALLNDSKYGYQLTRNQIGLTLLRSPKHPDEYADLGEHEFIYSIIPYKQTDLRTIIHKAYELNNKPILFQGSIPHDQVSTSLLTISNKNIVVECLKEAEVEKGIIIRMYESTGSYNKTMIEFITSINEIYETNMLEEKKEKIIPNSNKIELEFSSFETKTILILL